MAIDSTYNTIGGSLSQLGNIFKYINAVGDDIDIIIYITKKNFNLLDNISNESRAKIVVSKIAGISTITRVFWGQTFLPLYLSKEKVDVLFYPGNIAPIFSNVKTIQCIGTIGTFW